MCLVLVTLVAAHAGAVPAPAQQPGGTPHVRIDGKVDTKTDSGAPGWLPYLTAITATVGIFLVVAQLIVNRIAARDERTADLAERYYAREFQDVASKTLSFLNTRDVADCIARIRAWEARRHAGSPCLPRSRGKPRGPRPSSNDVSQVLFFFEDFSAAYNRKKLSRRAVHDTFPSAPVQVFTTGWWWLCWERRGGWVGRKPWRHAPELIRLAWLRIRPGDRSDPVETELYAHFEWMIRRIKKRVPATGNEDWHRGEFVLCVPPANARDQRALWDLAEAFSTRLTAYRGDRRKLVRKLKGIGKAHAGDPWEVVIVPGSMHEDRAGAQYRQSISADLGPALRGLDEADIDTAIAAPF